MDEDAKEVIRQKMKDEPEVIVESLLAHIEELECRIGHAFSMCNKLKAEFENHQHASDGTVLIGVNAYRGLCEGGMMKMPSIPLSQLTARLQHGDGPMGLNKAPFPPPPGAQRRG